MNTILVHLIIIYLIIVVFQYLYLNNYLNKFINTFTDDKNNEIELLEYNNKNIDEISKKFSRIILDRVKLLDNMSYSEWIDYNNKNSIVEIGKFTTSIFTYEKIGNNDKSDFILRSSENKDAIGLTYTDLLSQQKVDFLYTTFTQNPNLISLMYNMTKDEDGLGSLKYYSSSDIIKNPTEKKSIVSNWSKKIDEETTFTGVIFIGITLKDAEIDYTFNYYTYSNKYFVASMSILTLLASIILHYSKYSMSFYKPLSLLIVLNIYLTSYYSANESITTFEIEQSKYTDLNNGILALAFLIGVNTYILNKLQKLKNNKLALHSESSVYFLFAVLLMILCLYRISNYEDINSFRRSRINIGCMYNMSIIVNIYILFNYLLYIGINEKIIKIK
jgi:hypothetical protein